MRSSDRKRQQMALERSYSGFITRYLTYVRNEGGEDGPEMADGLEADLVEIFSSDKGVRVLIMLEKAILLSSIPDGASDSALREANAVRNHQLEIRRIVANGGR